MKTQRKRRIKRKTDYAARIGMLKSENPRIVIRKTNKHIILQYVNSFEAKDSVLVGVTSKDLLKYGWPEKLSGSLKSVPASYLTGYLIGKKILRKKLKSKMILDIGLQRNVSGSRLYAALKGIIDSGIEINHNPKIFPSEERILGKHLKSDLEDVFVKVKKNIEDE
ncbi:MAG: 50S ribosomal protein L18 [Candidatus Pacearchaeota archaeon]